MIVRRTVYALFLISLAIVAASPAHAASGSAPSTLTVGVEPATVDIGINYNGARVALSGTSPAGAQIAVKVSSPRIASPVSKKSQVGGLLWLTTDSATVEYVPSLFALYSSAPLKEILSPQDLARSELDPSFSPVLQEATVVNNGEEAQPVPASEAQQYLLGLRDIRVAQGLYYAREGSVELHGTSWSASLVLPAAAPPGSYEVTTYAISDKQIVGTTTATFRIEKTGAVELLAAMAHQNGPAYGTLAILAAACVGLGVGRLFGGTGH